jgi:hypothetical protein
MFRKSSGTESASLESSLQAAPDDTFPDNTLKRELQRKKAGRKTADLPALTRPCGCEIQVSQVASLSTHISKPRPDGSRFGDVVKRSPERLIPVQ